MGLPQAQLLPSSRGASQAHTKSQPRTRRACRDASLQAPRSVGKRKGLGFAGLHNFLSPNLNHGQDFLSLFARSILYKAEPPEAAKRGCSTRRATPALMATGSGALEHYAPFFPPIINQRAFIGPHRAGLIPTAIDSWSAEGRLPRHSRAPPLVGRPRARPCNTALIRRPFSCSLRTPR